MQPSVASWCSHVFSRWQWFEHVWENDWAYRIDEPIQAGPWLFYGGLKLFDLKPEDVLPSHVMAVKHVIGPMLAGWLEGHVRVPRAGVLPYVRVLKPFTVEDVKNAVFIYREAFDAFKEVRSHG